MRIRAVVARLPHKQEVEGSNPPSAIYLVLCFVLYVFVNKRWDYSLRNSSIVYVRVHSKVWQCTGLQNQYSLVQIQLYSL